MDTPTTPLQALQQIVQGGPYTNEDGEQDEVVLLPPIDPLELPRGQNDAGLAWPDEIKELLQYSKGFSVGGIEVDFATRAIEFPVNDIGWGHEVSPDGFGNMWFVEMDQTTGRWGAVWFLCHDPYAFVIQSPSITQFLLDVHTELQQIHKPLTAIHEGAVFKVYRSGGNLMSLEQAMQDRSLAPLLTGVDPIMRVCDLRNAEPGTGFTTRLQTSVRRLSKERVFLIPPKPPSIWTRLFGRKS